MEHPAGEVLISASDSPIFQFELAPLSSVKFQLPLRSWHSEVGQSLVQTRVNLMWKSTPPVPAVAPEPSPPLTTAQQGRQLRRGQGNSAGGPSGRPDEPALLQPLGQHAQADPVMPCQFDQPGGRPLNANTARRRTDRRINPASPASPIRSCPCACRSPRRPGRPEGWKRARSMVRQLAEDLARRAAIDMRVDTQTIPRREARSRSGPPFGTTTAPLMSPTDVAN
jgi:hypothetical protein